MRTIIAGSRGVDRMRDVVEAIEFARLFAGIKPTCVLSGTARGVDQLGERWASQNGIEIERYPAEWDKWPRRAGMIRNKQMAERADALIAVWDGRSPGTRDMIDKGHSHGLVVYIHRVSLD